ncbi:MAG: hypothetical protein KDB88_09490 [Flavobacteriales bacterium]|nr:hypothetical protein [Flavobacteriales bacterium]
MPKKRFSESDIEELLNHYRSERKRLLFQLEHVRAIISDLKSNDPSSPKRAIGTKAKKATAKKKSSGYKKKRGPRKKRTIKDGGYRLSDWDNVILDHITKTGKLQTKQDLLVPMTKFAAKADPKMKPEDVDIKLTRVLQKLSGRRGMLGTYRSGLQRGYHYGLKEWFFASTGKLRSQNLDRLDLATN